MQALNYSTQAIASLRILSKHHDVAGNTKTATMLGRIATVVESSHKFILPNGGWLFDGGLKSVMLPTFHLPFKTVCMEFQLLEGGRGCLVVCEEVDINGEQCACIVSLHWHEDGWYPFPVGAVIPYHQDIGEDGAANVKFWFPIGEQGKAYLNDKSRSVEERVKKIQESAYFDVTSAVQLCAALKCSNVSTERLDPPVKLQAKRAKEGKLPLFSYHILTVGNANPTAHTGATGSHSSPRTHLRRGHIRNHPTAGFVWVQSCVVNPGAKGSVNKDYAVVRSANGHA